MYVSCSRPTVVSEWLLCSVPLEAVTFCLLCTVLVRGALFVRPRQARSWQSGGSFRATREQSGCVVKIHAGPLVVF